MERRNDDASFYYSTPSEFSCRKHPSVSAVGICPYCLNDRLLSLVCSECGEHRLSSCSCSDGSSNAAVETGNVVRISYLIEEETAKQRKETAATTTTTKSRKTEEVVFFKRSSSSCVEIKKKSHRFSRIGRFLRKMNLKKERDFGVYGADEKKNDSWVLDYNDDGKKLGVSRSRSLCSFPGNECFIGSEEDGGSSYSGARSSFSAARCSSVNGGLGNSDTTEHRKSNFDGRKSNFSETTTEHRKSNFSEPEPPRRSGFEARKSNFSETEYPRRSNFSEAEYPRRSNFNETEFNRKGNLMTAAENNNNPRRSNFEAVAARKSSLNEATEQHRKSDSAAMSFTRRVFSMKESYFTGGEEPGFIDLKFDSSVRPYGHDGGGGGEVAINYDVLEHGGGGSCRLARKDGVMGKSRKSFKGWKWIFGHHHHHHQLHRHHHRDS